MVDKQFFNVGIKFNGNEKNKSKNLLEIFLQKQNWYIEGVSLFGNCTKIASAG